MTTDPTLTPEEREALADALRRSPNAQWLTLPGPTNIAPSFVPALAEAAERILAARAQAAPLTAEAVLREAAEAARGMHDPVAPDCAEWADWLDARADRARQAEVIARAQAGATDPVREGVAEAHRFLDHHAVSGEVWAWLNRHDAPWSPSDATVSDLAFRVLETTTAATRADTPAEVLERVRALLDWSVGRETGGVDRMIPASDLRAALRGDEGGGA